MKELYHKYKVLMLNVGVILSFLIAVGYGNYNNSMNPVEDPFQYFCKAKGGYYYKAYRSPPLCLSPTVLLLKE